MDGMVEVELWSTDERAVESVRATLGQLPGGDLVEADGRFYIPTGFPAWAAPRQGYVKRVIEACGRVHGGRVMA